MPFFLTPDNARLWYDDWHPPSPTATDVLFFLHGFTGYRNNWGYEKNGAAWLLRSRYRCIFLETRGIHASRQAKGPYTIEQQAKDVVALCDYLEVDKFTYCGHSMGGGTGFQLAATVPSRLHKMVLLAPMPSNGVPMRDPDPPQTRTHLTHHYSYPKWEDEKKAMERCVVLSEGRPSDTLSFFQDRARMVTRISQEYWIQSQRSIIALRKMDEMSRCQVPTLIIAGATDNLLRANVADSCNMPDCVLHVSSISGHETALQDPIGVSTAIHHFMSGRTLSLKKYRERVNRVAVERGHGPVPSSKL